ncbi:MAG: hypothetical protein H6728_04470 [Myxococcales bacterium]|nr:hypothetical protein [Myxococcales bacterium]
MERLRKEGALIFAETVTTVRSVRLGREREARLREGLESWLEDCLRDGLIQDQAQQASLRASLLMMLAQKDQLVSSDNLSPVPFAEPMLPQDAQVAQEATQEKQVVTAEFSVFPTVPYEEPPTSASPAEVALANTAALENETPQETAVFEGASVVIPQVEAVELVPSSTQPGVLVEASAKVVVEPTQAQESLIAEPQVSEKTGVSSLAGASASLYAPPRMPEGAAKERKQEHPQEDALDGDLSDVLPEGGMEAADLTDLPDLRWHEKESREDREVMEASSWARVLQPFLAQNWLYFLGTFLVLASGFYLLSLAWEGMSTLGRQSVIWGSLSVGSLAFSGLGILLKRRLELEVAGRSFGVVSLGLLGIAGMAAGPLWSQNILVASGVAGGTLALLVWGLRWLRDMDAGPTTKLGMWSSITLLLAVMIVPWVGRLGHIWGVVAVLSLGTLQFWLVARLWGALRFSGSFSWVDILCFWRSGKQEVQEEKVSLQEFVFFFAPQGYLWLLLAGWSSWSLGDGLVGALPFFAPLAALLGLALVEIGEGSLYIEHDVKSVQKDEPSEEHGGFFVWFWLGAMVSVAGLVLAWRTPQALVWSAGLLGVLFSRGSIYRARRTLEAASALSGLLSYLAFVGIWLASTGEHARWMSEVWWMPIQSWLLLPASLVLIVLGRRARGLHEMRGRIWPLVGALLALYGVVLLLWLDLAYRSGSQQLPLSSLFAFPLYALGFLLVGELRTQRLWSRLGLAFGVYGSSAIWGRLLLSWLGEGSGRGVLASFSVMACVGTALALWLVSRLLERRGLWSHSRESLDESLLWMPLVLLFFWSKQSGALGVINPYSWAPQTELLWGTAGLWLYGVFFFWWTRASASPLMAYVTLAWWGAASVLLGVTFRRWLGLPLGQGGGALVAVVVSFALFELGRRWRAGTRPTNVRLRLPWQLLGLVAGENEEDTATEAVASEGVWQRPLMVAAHIAWFAAIAMSWRVFLRGIVAQPLLLAILGLAALFAWQVAWRLRANLMGFVGFVLGLLVWGVAWIWPFLLRVPLERSAGWWGVLAFVGGYWLLWTAVFVIVRLWQGSIDGKPQWLGLFQAPLDFVPILGGLWLLGLGGLTFQAILRPQDAQLWWLLTAWGGGASLWYAMAWMTRRRPWVWMGAFSLLVMWSLVWWSRVTWQGLLVLGLAGVCVLYAIGSLRLWSSRKESVDALYSHGQLAFAVYKEALSLWGEGHRLFAITLASLALPGLWLLWHENLMPGELAAMGLALSIVPMFWEGWILSQEDQPQGSGWFVFALIVAGVGSTMGLFALLPASWQPSDGWLWWSMSGVVTSAICVVVMLLCGLRDPLALRIHWEIREKTLAFVQELYRWRLLGMPALEGYEFKEFAVEDILETQAEDAQDTEETSGGAEEQAERSEDGQEPQGVASDEEETKEPEAEEEPKEQCLGFSRWMATQKQPKSALGRGWMRLGQVAEGLFFLATFLNLSFLALSWWFDGKVDGWLLTCTLPLVASMWLRPRDGALGTASALLFMGWYVGAVDGAILWGAVWGMLLPFAFAGTPYWRGTPHRVSVAMLWAGGAGCAAFGLGLASSIRLFWPQLDASWVTFVAWIAVATLCQLVMIIARLRGGRLEALFEMVAWGRASDDAERAVLWGDIWHSTRHLYKVAMIVAGVFAISWVAVSWPRGGAWLVLFCVPALLDLGQSFQRFSWIWLMSMLSLWGLHWAPYWLGKQSWSVWLWSCWALGALWLAAESTAAGLWHHAHRRGSLRWVWMLWHLRGLSASMALFFAGCGIVLYAGFGVVFASDALLPNLSVSALWLQDAKALPWWVWLLVPVLYVAMVMQLRQRSAAILAMTSVILSPWVMVFSGAGIQSNTLFLLAGVLSAWLLLVGLLLGWSGLFGEKLRKGTATLRGVADGEAAQDWSATAMYRFYYPAETDTPPWLSDLGAVEEDTPREAERLLRRRLFAFLWELPDFPTFLLSIRRDVVVMGGFLGVFALAVFALQFSLPIPSIRPMFWVALILLPAFVAMSYVRVWSLFWFLGLGLLTIFLSLGAWQRWATPWDLLPGGWLAASFLLCCLGWWWLRKSQRFVSSLEAGRMRVVLGESYLRQVLRGKAWHPGLPPHSLWFLQNKSFADVRSLSLVVRALSAIRVSSFLTLLLAWACFRLAYGVLVPATPLVLHLLALLILLTQAWLWVRWALDRDREWMAYVGAASFLGVYGYLRGAMGIGERGFDAWVFLVMGFLLLGFRELWQRMGGPLLQRVAQRLSYILPLLALLAGAWNGQVPPIASWLIAGVFYGVLAHQYGLRWLAVPSLLFLNVGIFLFLGQKGISTAQWYVLPVGLSLFVIAGVFAQDLGQRGRNLFRIGGALAIYLTSMVQVLSFQHITDVLLLGGLAIAGVILGIALRIRSFLFLGVGFLVTDVVVNLFRVGLQDRVIGMIFLFLTGVLLLAAAVFFNLKREAILARIRNWQDQMASWE